MFLSTVDWDVSEAPAGKLPQKKQEDPWDFFVRVKIWGHVWRDVKFGDVDILNIYSCRKQVV